MERSSEKTESRRRSWEWAAGKWRTTEPRRRAEGRVERWWEDIWERRNFNTSSDEKASAGSRVSTEYRGGKNSEVRKVPLMSCLKEIESRPAVNKEEKAHICPSPLASGEIVKPFSGWAAFLSPFFLCVNTRCPVFGAHISKDQPRRRQLRRHLIRHSGLYVQRQPSTRPSILTPLTYLPPGR